MSIEQWPATLQQYLNEENFAEKPRSTKVKSENDVGPPKVRNRYTKPYKEVNATITFEDKTHYTTFVNFFETTLANGTKKFYFDHPIEEDQRVYRFKDEYAVTPIGGEAFRVSFVWEQMP